MQQETKEPKIKDVEYIAEWRSMLDTFSETIKGNPSVDKVKGDLMSLIEVASNTTYLKMAQKDAIIARCRNYINGSYGKNQVKTNYIHNNTD